MRRNTRGVATDKTLLDVIRKAHGLSMYELGQRTGWNIGHVDGAVRRLLKSHKIIVKVVDRNGRRLNLVYPLRIEHPNLVEVPRNLLNIGNPTWLNEAYVYALDANTIGISGKKNDDWESFIAFKDVVDLITKGAKVSLRLPQKFVDFYGLESRHVVKTINGNNVLLTVSGNIIETKQYPS